MSDKLIRSLNVEPRIVSEAEGLVDYVASDATLDSYKEIIDPKGWRFTHFAKNAPFVNSHDYWIYDRHHVILHRLNFTLDVLLVDASWPALTTIYRPADYAFISPPPGFAAGLQGAQGWVPYSGFFEEMREVAGAASYRGKCVNFTHARPDLAAMGGLVAAETWELDRGAASVRLGAPARLDYRSVVDKIRSHSSQQIVYL